MPLMIKALSGVNPDGQLNSEWMVVENDADRPLNLEGCSITVGKGGGRPRVVTTFKAGLVIKPHETCRLVSGSSGKKSHGEAPTEEEVRNIHLFLKAPYLDKPGTTIRLMNRQMELAKAVFEPEAAA